MLCSIETQAEGRWTEGSKGVSCGFLRAQSVKPTLAAEQNSGKSDHIGEKRSLRVMSTIVEHSRI